MKPLRWRYFLKNTKSNYTVLSSIYNFLMVTTHFWQHTCDCCGIIIENLQTAILTPNSFESQKQYIISFQWWVIHSKVPLKFSVRVTISNYKIGRGKQNKTKTKHTKPQPKQIKAYFTLSSLAVGYSLNKWSLYFFSENGTVTNLSSTISACLL